MSTTFYLACLGCSQYVELATRFAGGARVFPPVPGTPNVPDRIGEFVSDHYGCRDYKALAVLSEHDLPESFIEVSLNGSLSPPPSNPQG